MGEAIVLLAEYAKSCRSLPSFGEPTGRKERCPMNTQLTITTSSSELNTAHPGQRIAREALTRIDAGSVYYLTEVGEILQMKSKTTLDKHFARILSVIKGDTHIDVIRGCLRHYTDAQLDHWLKNLEIAGALKVRPSDFIPVLSAPNVGLPRREYEAALTDTDVLRIDVGALLGASALKTNSAYLAEERLQNRAPVRKPPREIAVLLVEDDPEQAELASRQLGVAGYQVRVADSHLAFLAALRDHGVPDAILLDVQLPDGDGFDLLNYVRHDSRLALVPVIMFTAQGDLQQIRMGLALGADGYLPKPYSKSTLIDTLRRVLKHS
jgi:two-component system phosphate regulon response regulator PhoB